MNQVPKPFSVTCIKWQSDAPFFAEFLLRFLYKEDSNLPTLGVAVKDRKIMLYYNKDFVESLPKNELEGVLMHEILHVLHKFHDRLSGRDIKIFNVAQDACINHTVTNTTIDGRQLAITKDGVYIEKIREMGYKGDIVTEPVYDFLYEKAEKKQVICSSPGESGEGEDGEDGHGNSNGGEGPKRLQTTDNHKTFEGQSVDEASKQAIEEIVNNAKTRSWGKINGNGLSEIKELIKTKTIPWRKKLAMYLSKYVNEPGSIYENTWSRRNRRQLPLPGIRKQSKKLVITIDTSGSVGDDDLAKFFSQIEKLVKDYSSLTIIEWDTQVNNVYGYRKGAWRRIKPKGRGGTAIQPAIDYIKENIPKASVVIHFTDGYFYTAIDNKGLPTIWAIVNNPNFEIGFGKIVHIVDKDK